MTIEEVKLVELPKILDERGNLSFLEEHQHIPFKIERVHWIYDVPGGENRGGHSYKVTHELIIALSGSFDIVVFDGKNSKVYALNRSYYALLIPAGIWRHMENFSTNSLALVASSTKYQEADYIRDLKAYPHEA